jgi:hypothetical protein
MAGWTLVPCLVELRSEFNAIAPSRDRSSDGSVGDARHQAGRSDHNPDSRGLVHAIDVDVDLRTSGLTMELVVQRILARCRSGAEKRLRYVIFNRRIWEASNGWRERRYTGPNPHDHHAHFSSSYETALEASTASWHLTDQEDDDMGMSPDDWKKLDQKLAALATPATVWSYKLPAVGKTAAGQLVEANQRAGSAANSQLPKLATAITQLAGGQIDQAALVAALVPALTEAIVSRLPQDHDDVTAAELKDAIVAAARDLLT